MLKKRYADKPVALLIGICFAGLLAACGQKEEIQSTNLKVEKNGTVISTIVEDFGKEYYSAEGLETMISEEINAFNGDNPEAVSLKEVMIPQDSEGLIMVTMQFASAENYADFNDTELFYGTLIQAKEAGYTLPQKLLSASDLSKTIGQEEITAAEKKYVLIFAENTMVQLPKKAVYISEGINVIDQKTIDVEQAEGLHYVIME